jgi:glycosyltransferase involved in cell wall biosynthesis
MRVLHVIPSLSPTEGGPSFAAKSMADALAGQGLEVTIAATRRHSDASAAAGDYGYKVICFRRKFEPYKISFGLTRWLRANIRQFDLVHIHALFSFSSTMAARIARQNAVPYVVRPLGVLNRWGMENRRPIPKLISFRVVELPILLHAAAIHYTSEAERNEAALLDPRIAKHESVVIPLPIEPAAKGDAERFLDRYPKLRGRKIILFLSRIDRKKGLELLLDAFALVRGKDGDVALVIAGNGEEAYARELRERARRSLRSGSASGSACPTEEEGKEDKTIIWTGHLSGEMKAAALAASDVFAFPSASENFGIAAAESLAAGVPTIVSEEVALSADIRRYDAGMVVQRDAQQLADAIGELLSDRERAAGLALNGRRLAEERYSPEAVGRALHELYQKIIT